MTETSWPRSISASARSLMCCCTPPGTSQEYGHTMPIRIERPLRESCAHRRSRAAVAGAAAGQAPGVEVVDEDLLQHVPVFRVLADLLLEGRCQGLGHRGD